MKILKLLLISLMFIFLTSFTADSSYAACAEPYKYSCLIGGITLCSKVSTCDNYLITQAGDASCKEKGHAYFDSIQAGLSDQTVCKMYCAGLTPQSCPADYTAFTEPDYASNICRTVCVKTSSCTGSVQCESTEPILCQNGYKPATLSCEGRSFVTCKNTTCGAPGKFSCTLSKVEATPSISGGACSAGQYCVKFSVSYSGYPNRGTKNQHWNFGNGTGDNNSTYTTFRGYNYGSGSKSVTLEAWENGGSGNYASCPITVSVPSSDGTAPTATRTPTRTPTNTPIPGGGGGTAPTATRTPTNTPIPDGGGGGGGDDTYPPILYLDIRLFNDANNNGSKDIGEKNNTGAGTITTSTSMSPNCSGSGTRSYSFNKGGVSLGPGDSLTNDPMCVYVQSFDGPVIHDNPRMVTPSASASDYWFGVYISEVPTSTPTPTVPAGTTYNITGTVYVDNDPEGPGLCTSSTPVGDLSVTLSGSTGSIKVASVGSTGTYALNGSTGLTAPYALTVSKTGYSLRAVKTGSGPFVTAGPGNDYPITNLSTTYTFCLKDNTETVVPWFMTQIGSVRQQHITNTVPAGQLPTTTDNTASVFYSTQGITNLGSALGTKWTVNQEYDRVKGLNRPGNASFSFYKNRAQTVGIELIQLCPGNTGECHISGTTVNAGLANGVYYHPGNVVLDTDVTITNTPKRFVILSEGSITLKGQVRLVNTPNSLIIFAAKENIIVDPTVGTTPSNTAFNIQAILSAENNIQLPSSASCPTPDKRLNIEGTLIANADNPFGQEIAGGKLLNNRTLCTDNASYPSLFVRSRLSFITQLSDFYKLTSKFWNEVAP